VMSSLVAQGPGDEEHESRTHPLAAAVDNVFCDLSHQNNFGMEPVADDRIDGLHVRPDQGR